MLTVVLGFFSVSGLQGKLSSGKTLNIFGMCKEQLPLKAKTKTKPKQNKAKKNQRTKQQH